VGRTGVRVYMMRRERLEVSGECRVGGRSGHDGACEKPTGGPHAHLHEEVLRADAVQHSCVKEGGSEAGERGGVV